MSPFIAELLGTMIIVIFGTGVVAGVVLKNSKAESSGWIVISFGWGLGVMAAIYTVGKYSGAHLNPAVTLALALIGKFAWKDVAGFILAQTLGAFIGALVVYFQYLPHWEKTEDAESKLGVFCTGPAVSSSIANMLSEIIGTFILVFCILTLGANELSVGIKPLLVGLLVTAIILALGGTTGAALNPARDLAPRLAHFLLPIPGKRDSNWKYSWIPVVSPIIGGVYGALMYAYLVENSFGLLFYAWSSLIALLLIGALYENSKRTVPSVSSAKFTEAEDHTELTAVEKDYLLSNTSPASASLMSSDSNHNKQSGEQSENPAIKEA